MAPKWADVESNNVLQQMLRDIATGTKSVSDATKWADGEITRILNELTYDPVSRDVIGGPPCPWPGGPPPYPAHEPFPTSASKEVDRWP